MLGLGMACKITAVAFLPVLLVAVGIRLWPLLNVRHLWNDAVSKTLLRLMLALIVAFLAFRVYQPYAFDTPKLSNVLPWTISLNKQWVDNQKEQAKLLGGDALFPPSVQWIDRASYVYPLENMLEWGMGPAFGLAGWLALAYGGYRILRYREARHLLPVVFVLVYFGFMGRQFSLYMRYFLPLYPALAVLAGYGLMELYGGAKALARRIDRPWLETAGAGVAGLVLVGGLLAGLAYLSIYTRPFTRAEASRWMFANIPSGASIAAEEWDESLPLNLPGAAEKHFQVFGLNLYEPDSPQKSENLISDLDKADYVTISSNRLMNSIPRNKINFPLSSHYYDMLLNGELGFRLVGSFTSYPGLFGIDFSDHSVQESWSSYDHPRVLIFEKAPDYSRANLEAKLGNGPWAQATVPPAGAEKNALLLSSADLKTQQQGGTWTDVFSSSGIAHSAPTLVWLLALEAAAFAVTPLALMLFRRLPDRGYLLSKPLGVVLLAYPVWLIVSLKLVHFEQTTIMACLVALALAGTAIAWWRRAELLGFVRENWRLILFSEAVFLIAFFFFRELRLDNPDLWHPYRGGEKPMDLAYFTAVTRSTTLPPYDPWFAGGYINYYYLGQFFSATLTKLTTIPPETAYNLLVPTYFALTVAGAFSVAYNLAAAGRRFVRAPGFRRAPAWSLYAAGLLGAIFVAVAGNLDGVGQMVERLSAVSSLHANTNLPLVDGVINSIGGAWQVVFHGANLQRFDYWRSSRMMPPTISITEFPFFSFLFADLHAHMMAIAFQILAIALCLALVVKESKPGSLRTPLKGRAAGSGNGAAIGSSLSRRVNDDTLTEIGLIALLGLIVGSLRWINSWDYPPFLLLGLTAILISERYPEGGVGATLRRFVLKAALLGGLSFLLYEPFLAHYKTPVSGVIAAPEQTPIHQYLAHFGLFAALLGAWLVFMVLRALKASRLGRGASSLHTTAGETARELRIGLAVAAVVLMLVGCYALALGGQPLVAALLPVFGIAVLLGIREVRLQRPDGGLRLFLLALIGLGLGLSIGVDIVTLKGDIVRMNTVFKFYLHVWVVFALASSFVLWQLGFVIWPRALRAGRRATRYATCGALAAVVLLVLGVLIYPFMATPVRLDDRFATLPQTLDGEAYMQTAVYNDAHGPIDLYYDYLGIEWMRQNVQGTPAIVEGRTDLYRWGGRFSIYTGLPTVLGWDWHQTQQRGDLAFMVSQRGKDVDKFYSDPDVGQAVSFLQEYGVRYVIVGQVERLYYLGDGLAKFDSGLNGALEVAYQNPDLTIYRVKDAALAKAP
jgi:YYY domain-containing protein